MNKREEKVTIGLFFHRHTIKVSNGNLYCCKNRMNYCKIYYVSVAIKPKDNSIVL